MSAAGLLPAPRRFNEASYLDFLVRHEDGDGRWELIEGIPIQMPPATMRHGRIASNLERLLSSALARSGSRYDARREVGVRHTVPDFRPVADVAIIDPQEETDDGDDRFYDACPLIAEVLSPSTEHYDLIWKLPRYRELGSCRYILLLSQSEDVVRLFRRDTNWSETVLRGPDDLLELPEFGLACRLADLYRGVVFS